MILIIEIIFMMGPKDGLRNTPQSDAAKGSMAVEDVNPPLASSCVRRQTKGSITLGSEADSRPEGPA
jgi:hypothetical protein